MKRLLLVALALTWILVSVNPAFSAANLTGLNRLEGITVTEKEGEIATVFKFAHEYKGAFTPSFYPRSIQIDLPNVYTSPAKREFHPGAGSVSNMTAAQLSLDKVRTRLFVSGDPRAFSSGWKVKKDGATVTLMLEKKAAAHFAPVKDNTPERAVSSAKPLAVEAPQVAVTPRQDAVTSKSLEKDAEDLLVMAEKESAGNLAKTAEPTKKEKVEPAPTQGVVGKGMGFLAKPAYAAEAPKDVEPPKSAEPEKAQGKKLIAYEEPKAPEAPSLTAMTVKMIGALALVVSLVLALAWVAQKYMGKFNTAFGNSGMVRVLTTSSIGVKKQISVVDVAGEIIVLGISGDSITMLTTIDNMESADRLRRMAGGGDKGGTIPRNITEYMKNMGGSEKGGGLLKKLASSLGAKADKGFSQIPPALMDEDNPVTFAGNLKVADSEPRERPFVRPTGKVETKDMGPSLSRDELMRKVTGAIRAKNGSLGIA